jgi:hypothetical protein
MDGKALDESVRPLVAPGAQKEDRVVLRLRPYATFETPPRHVHSEADINRRSPTGSAPSLPWADGTDAA